ncbi:MAG: ACT domain-containing protein [Candidatus Bathyarchaeota archaeon]|nr:ACT domain-containing protein [Candidatus Bathyarchaeota archaeon]
MRKLFSEVKIREHNEDYTVISLGLEEAGKAGAILTKFTPFCSVTCDTFEVSVISKTVEWHRVKCEFTRFSEAGPYRVLTFDIVLDLAIIGFMAVVSSVLAENGVSIYPISTYLRDHILVKKEDAEKAIRLLNELVEDCR